MNKLEQAAELIENGWCTGQLRNGDGKYCSVGAVLATYGISEEELEREGLSSPINGTNDPYEFANALPEIKALADEIRSTGYVTNQTANVDVVYWWNDEQQDGNVVLETFKHAAKRL